MDLVTGLGLAAVGGRIQAYDEQTKTLPSTSTDVYRTIQRNCTQMAVA